MILIKGARAQVQHVQFVHGIQLQLGKMQPENWARARRRLCSKAAQVHCIAESGILNCAGNRVADSILLSPVIRGSYSRGNHQERSSNVLESPAKRLRIIDIANERLGSL